MITTQTDAEPLPPPLEQSSSLDTIKFFRKPSYLLLTTAGTIIISEILIMTAIRYLPPMGFLPEALLDGVMLSFIVFPSLYFFVFKYLNEQITQNKLLENELRKALDTAHATNDTMSRLLRTVAHEFRTPLGLLTGSTDLLDQYWDRLTAEERFEQNEYIRSAARQMSTLVNSVIAFSQLGTVKAENSLQMVNVEKICRSIVAEVVAVWGSGHECTVEIDLDCKAVMLDEVLFRRILENLLTNSFRYTASHGSVMLKISLKNLHFSLEIIDTGIGIPQDDLSKIFDAFYRSENVEGRRGLGLGLSIVQDALSQMNGTISVTSQVGKGTTMSVMIPCRET